ncbi:MAG: zinc metalloprotease HtpX [Firmicutes bacterium]|nr:zinc metalloprotease HtpX [Bacillota bacterium]
MTKRALPFDSGLAARMFLTMFLLAALYLGFAWVLFRAGAGASTMVVVIGIMLVAQYYFSDRLVLWSTGAREVSPGDAPDLHALVERLAALADMPKPRVAVVESPIPNAFATGRNQKNAVVAVTTGLLGRLETPEVEAVLAHEMAHIKNRDMTVMTIASFFATVASFIVQQAFYWGLPMGRGGYGNDDRRNGGGFMLVYLASLLVWLISYFLIRALSRYREYAADRGGAILIGAPSRLASALQKISGAMERIPQRDLRQAEGLNAFFIIPALQGESFMELFSTHPSLENRLEHLRRLEQAMEAK